MEKGKLYPIDGETPWRVTNDEIRRWTRRANETGFRIGFGGDHVGPGHRYYPGLIAAAQDIALDDLVERYGTSL